MLYTIRWDSVALANVGDEVLAVMHRSRGPGYWHNRLGRRVTPLINTGFQPGGCASPQDLQTVLTVLPANAAPPKVCSWSCFALRNGTILRVMATNLEKLAKEAMALPGEERAELAEMLVQSLGGSELSDIGRLWVMEAKRRLDEVTDGVVEPIPGGEALRKVRDLISRPD